ncbi:DNA primase small subunit [Gigaspora margarita]|uniref:DNA primase small subunit n=1 Tax=Gigaspora margarita TaxID=4874 RepID=A0A8H4AU98_GIGMA|nr:DNA primase small subunit [Gigaspora margarita]
MEELVNELEHAASVLGRKFSKKAEQLQICNLEIIFQYNYPRLDESVSKNVNHLLKSPFYVHPKIGRACVLIQPDDCENFDPFEVPTVSSLYQELNLYIEEERKVHGYPDRISGQRLGCLAKWQGHANGGMPKTVLACHWV